MSTFRTFVPSEFNHKLINTNLIETTDIESIERIVNRWEGMTIKNEINTWSEILSNCCAKCPLNDKWKPGNKYQIKNIIKVVVKMADFVLAGWEEDHSRSYGSREKYKQVPLDRAEMSVKAFLYTLKKTKKEQFPVSFLKDKTFSNCLLEFIEHYYKESKWNDEKLQQVYENWQTIVSTSTEDWAKEIGWIFINKS